MCSLSQLFLCALLLTPNAIANNDKASFSDVIVKDGSTEYEIGHRVSSQMATSRLMNRNRLVSRDCWICQSPCSEVYCCDGLLPQCSIIGGLCVCSES
ncbi:hypothetical protein AFLA_006949 [Aspergillus flavus NRRL3357]|nr:hypothetical protein AFLA_006949 [Aspergillus flavus NRRL3357]